MSYKRPKTPVRSSNPTEVSNSQTARRGYVTDRIYKAYASYQLAVSSRSGTRHRIAIISAGRLGTLIVDLADVSPLVKVPLWDIDPLISGFKVVGRVAWTPALGGRNLR